MLKPFQNHVPRFIHACTGTLLVAAACSAHAQQPPGNAENTLSTGLAVAYTPRYEGSDETRIRVLPVIRASYHTRVGKFSIGGDASGVPGLSWSMIDTPNFEGGIALGYDMGRKESVSEHLRGLGDVGRTAEAGVFGVYKIGAASLRLATSSALGNNGHGGSRINAGAGYRWHLSDKLGLSNNIGVTWASTDYMQSYFGVSPEQAANSGLARYTAKAGIKDIGLGVGLDYTPYPNWSVVGGYGFSRLQGNIADSPIVQQRNQQRLFGGVTYRW